MPWRRRCGCGRRRAGQFWLSTLGAVAAAWWPGGLYAQTAAPADAPEDWAVHGQATFVTQYHPPFYSAYRGANSLDPGHRASENADLTLYLGLRPWAGGELWLDPEILQGFGLSNAVGLAGFANGETAKLGASDPYARLQRVFLRQTIDLGGATTPVAGDLNQLAGTAAADRIVITLGKFSVVDIFDTNKYAHDPRNDFLNLAVIDIASFDYPADPWGYTYGAVVEWYRDWWALRTGMFTLSTFPNSLGLDTRPFDQFQLDEEAEESHSLFGQPGKLKLLGFMSDGRIAEYDEAVALAAATGTPVDPAAVRRRRLRFGAGLNLEQQIADGIGGFARLGAAQGQYEAVGFTDADRSLSAGVSVSGARWHRPKDNFGLAVAINDISAAARRYFDAGGLGLLIGDGALTRAGPEQIVETYYSLAAFDVAMVTLDYQYIVNPAYNRDRGPVSIFGLRLHAQF